MQRMASFIRSRHVPMGLAMAMDRPGGGAARCATKKTILAKNDFGHAKTAIAC